MCCPAMWTYRVGTARPEETTGFLGPPPPATDRAPTCRATRAARWPASSRPPSSPPWRESNLTREAAERGDKRQLDQVLKLIAAAGAFSWQQHASSAPSEPARGRTTLRPPRPGVGCAGRRGPPPPLPIREQDAGDAAWATRVRVGTILRTATG